jgi:WD40 repeat protein/serine/threonine protein kinase
MKPELKRTCPSCGHEFSGALEFCPVCMLRKGLAAGVESGASTVSKDTDNPTVAETAIQRFEHYELATGEDGKPVELGRGAMGVTYKAYDIDLRCPVTLKVISPRYLADESTRLRFLREARAAASVRHPNVASVFHLGKIGENYFYAMEFVEGENLETFIRCSGRLEPMLALEIAAQVAAGLGAVHKKNLVHRDIKPSNIMVSLDERGFPTAKVIDLGLAKTPNDPLSEAVISMPGVFVGTPEFASPEQFAGADVDIRSDLYSLGITLWKMLTGQVPFRGSLAELVNKHRHALLPVERLENVPQPLLVLIDLLLEKDPAKRFQNPAELLDVMPLVRGAIHAGQRLKKTVRVFVSSAADVQKERHVANRVIRSIAAEYDIPVSGSQANSQRLAEEVGEPESAPEHHGALVLCPYFLEYQKSNPEVSDQERIPNTGGFDLVICIVWSRLGGPFAPGFKMPDGSPPASGTEYEIAWATDHAKKSGGVPLLLVYRNCSKPTPPLEPKEEREAFGRQWDSLQEFFTGWEKNNEGNFSATCKYYRGLQEFEELFREHFREFLAGQVERKMDEKGLDRKARRWKSRPFRGLNFFDVTHAQIFHGRTSAIGAVLEALEAQVREQRPFVLVLGASGSGKSSLVRAGVLPLLTQPQVMEGVGLWRWSVSRPGAGGGGGDCFDALAAALLEPTALPQLRDPETLDSIRDLAAVLREHPDSGAFRVRDALDHAAREWKIRQSHSMDERERQMRESGRSEDADFVRQQRQKLELPRARLALVVDQLEELFTTGFSSEVQHRYISALASLVRSGRVFVLATLRSDFYTQYQEFPDLIELTNPRGKFDLRPPTPYELGKMIRLPAEAAGLRFEQDPETGQGLDQALRDAASATPESLPLLEHVLSLLYDRQEKRGDDLLRWSDYCELGQLEGALAKHAEGVFNALQPHEQSAFAFVMRHLVTLGQGEEDVPNRRTAPYRDIVAAAETDDAQKAGAKGFVDSFVEKRLLVADADAQGEVSVSVAHEALLREWQRVKEWLAQNREFLRMRGRLDSSMKLWLSRGKQKDDLLGPGLPLAEGEKLVKDFGPSLSREQTDYILESIAERKRRKQAEVRIRYTVMTAISVLAILAGFQWLRAERQRQSAERNAALAEADEARTKQALASEAEVAGKLQEQLQQASWASFNQGERQLRLGEWPEALTLLARAIKFNPANEVASQRFFQELIVHRAKALPPLLASFDHQDVVYAASFSPDGTRILTASWDKTAKLWDAASGKLIFSFPHKGTVNTAVFSPDGARILTASADRTAKLWDTVSGKLIASIAHQGIVNNATFSPDGGRILTASVDHSAKLWDVASGKSIASFAHQNEVTYAAFNSDGTRIITTSLDKTAKLWDASSGELLASFDHQAIVYRGAFSPDGAWVLTAGKDGTAKLWDAASGRLIASFVHRDVVYGAVFSPDGTRILTASADKSAKLWDVASGKLMASFAHQDAVVGAAFSSDGVRILTASWDKTAKLWDAASGKLIASFAHQDELNFAAFSPDDTRILTASWDKTAKLWEVASGELVASFVHQDGLYHAAFSRDRSRILTGSADRTAKLWDAVSGKLVASFDHQDGVTRAAFSPDDTRILTASADKTAKLWDAGSGKLIALFAHQDVVNNAGFSPDGARILTASKDGTAKLWDAITGKLVGSFDHKDAVFNALFSRNGTQILTASADHSAKLWDATSGKLMASFDHQDPVYDAAFSPDDARILTASADHSARLWDTISGKLIASFHHQDEVNTAVFSPDGARVLTASLDKTAKLWEAASGRLIASFLHEASVNRGTFSPNGAQILTASADNTAKLWDAASGKLIASFDHQDAVRWAAFSSDGARILTASWDKTAKLWDAATPASLALQLKESDGSPARISSSGSLDGSPVLQVEALAVVAGGLEISDDGSLVAADEERRSQLARLLRDAVQNTRPNGPFIPWFFQTVSDRTIFPASSVKVVDWVDNALLTNPNVTEEWLRNALVFLPQHALLHIALAGFENDSKRADFLRRFGISRLPKNSVVCTRAGEMLLAQRTPELALSAVEKALLADSKDQAAQRLRLKVLDAMAH